MTSKPRVGASAARFFSPTRVWTVVAALAVFLFLQHGRALTAPFFSDDYIFLDKLMEAPFRAVWSAERLAYHWYRPWSRELHYWTFYRLFSLNTVPYHLACFALWLTAMGLYWTLVRRIAGAGVATVATCGVAAMAAWGVLIEWSPGVQDLWMMVLALASLLAFSRHRQAWATAALALALLSKETAAVVPAIALAYALAIDRETPRAALRRVLPLVVLVALWAVLHPALGGHWWWTKQAAPLPSVRSSPFLAALRSVLALANLDLWPRPLSGWTRALLAAAPGAIVLALLAWRAPKDAPAERRGVIRFGAAWTIVGFLPLLAPSVLWQSYYALFGALGAWLAIAAALVRARVPAVATIGVIALLGVARSDTPARDWGNEWTLRFGKEFMGRSESYFSGRFPESPRHARFFFTTVPRGVVFVTGRNETPALHVWFRDSTLRGGFWSDYRSRAPHEPKGPDHFFRYDSLSGWVEVIQGHENVDSMRALDARWKPDHERLGFLLAESGDVAAARIEFEKLSVAYPEVPDYPYLAGITSEAMGDSAAARAWYGRAARLPGADEQVRAKAKAFGIPP